MAFKGELEVLELNEPQRTLHLVGKGSDTTGSSGASMDLVARIEPGSSENDCNLVGRSEVTMSGKAAAFGGRMMGSVADQILKQFAGNFATQVKSHAEAASPPPEGARADPAAGTPPAPANELNGLALFWAIVRDWFRGIFRRKPA